MVKRNKKDAGASFFSAFWGCSGCGRVLTAEDAAVVAKAGVPGQGPQQVQRLFSRRQVQRELGIGHCKRAAFHYGCVAGDQHGKRGEKEGDMSRRVARRGDHLTAPAPGKKVAAVQQTIHRSGLHGGQPPAELAAPLLSLRRQGGLEGLRLDQTKRFFLAGNIGRFLCTSQNMYLRIGPFELGQSAYVVIVMVGDDHSGQVGGRYSDCAEGLLQPGEKAGVTAVDQNCVAAIQQQGGKQGLLTAFPGQEIGRGITAAMGASFLSEAETPGQTLGLPGLR